MTEMENYNRKPLNVAAEKALEKVGQKPDPTMLYSLQLMDWALRNNVQIVMRTNQYDLQVMIENLLIQDPKAAMTFLLKPAPNETRMSPKDQKRMILLAQASPIEAAVELLNMLHSAMTEKLPGYPIP